MSVHVGVHMLITLKNIPEHVKLMRVDTVKPLMQKVIKACDLHVVAEVGHQFEHICVRLRGVTFFNSHIP